jgi:hypothetical protein
VQPGGSRVQEREGKQRGGRGHYIGADEAGYYGWDHLDFVEGKSCGVGVLALILDQGRRR